MDEFELIKTYFSDWEIASPYTVLGIGDDCAIFDLPKGEVCAVSTDTFLEGTHFFSHTDPYSVGHKALAVNVSDLAAMGARPLGFTLSLSIPKFDRVYLERLSQGMKALAEKCQIPLLGGDTVKGPLSITITVFGSVVLGHEFRRSLAKAGDHIMVSGALGGASIIVEKRYLEKAPKVEFWETKSSLDLPNPRIDLVVFLKKLKVRCAMDISDGLLGDLGHILETSHKKAELYWENIPKAVEVKDLPFEEQARHVLSGGDDYELLFTLSEESFLEYKKLKNSQSLEIPELYEIGKILNFDDALADICLFRDGKSVDISKIHGYSHF